MEKQKPFSHGLLYSVSPENFSSLHLQDEGRTGEFEWGEFKTIFSFATMTKCLLSFLKKRQVVGTILKRLSADFGESQVNNEHF